MKKKTFITVLLLSVTLTITSCGTIPTTSASTTPVAVQSNSQQDISKLESLLGGLKSSQQDTSSGIGNIIGQIVGAVTGKNVTIVGSWSYSEPSVQFESENLLAQAGGAVATNSIVEKIKPYYEKVGFKAGALAYTFNEDKTCTITLGSKKISGTYEYDKEANTIIITNKLGLKIMTAYATVSANNLALTFDATKLLVLAQTLGAKSSNTTLSGLTSLSQSFNGMKMGFLCTRQ